MDDGILEVARAIRPYLRDLAGDEAERYDAEIRTHLAKAAAGDDVTNPMLRLLGRNPAVHAWAAQALADPDHRPPEFQASPERGMQPLTNDGQPISIMRYACPVDGNYVWYRHGVGIPVRKCPDHDVQLIET